MDQADPCPARRRDRSVLHRRIEDGLCLDRTGSWNLALGLASTHDTETPRRALCLCNNGTPAFWPGVPMEIDHHPITCAPELMRQRRVRIERGEVPGSAHGMQDRQPGLAAWIEALWRDLAQCAAGRPYPGTRDRRRAASRPPAHRRYARRGGLILASSELSALRTMAVRRAPKPGTCRRRPSWAAASSASSESSVQRRLDLVRQRWPDAWDRAEQRFWVSRPFQPFEEAPPAGHQHFRDGPGNRRPYARNGFQRRVAAGLPPRSRTSASSASIASAGTTVGRNAKWIGALGREQARRLAKPLGDPAIAPL